MRNNQSEEDYVERILVLKERKGNVRAVDIAKDMGFSKPSISVAMKKLEEKKYIEIDNFSGYINLTESGMQLAQKIYERHKVLTSLFAKLGVKPEVAEDDACKIEHDLSEETFSKLKELENNMK